VSRIESRDKKEKGNLSEVLFISADFKPYSLESLASSAPTTVSGFADEHWDVPCLREEILSHDDGISFLPLDEVWCVSSLSALDPEKL